MKRWLSNILTVLSLVACGAVLVMWFVGCWHRQVFVWHGPQSDHVDYVLAFDHGCITYGHTNFRPEFSTAYRPTPLNEWHNFRFAIGLFPTGYMMTGRSFSEAIMVPYGFLVIITLTFPIVRHYRHRKPTWLRVGVLVVWTLGLALFEFPVMTFLFGGWGMFGAAIIVIPYGILAALSLRRFQRERRLAQGLCPNCGYDVRLSQDRCPECGMPTTTGAKT